MIVIKRIIKPVYFLVLRIFFPKIYETRCVSGSITLKNIFFQKILGINRQAYWPMHFTSVVQGAKNIYVGIGSTPGFGPGCYIQGIGRIYIGNYVLVAPNVGIISANHDIYDHSKHVKDTAVIIGDYSWIGMNSVILPNVVLGEFTIVAAGSVVTKSFQDGYCIIAGNPARIIKKLDKDKCVRYKNKYEYYGFYRKEEFEKKYPSVENYFNNTWAPLKTRLSF